MAALIPDLLYRDGRFEAGLAVEYEPASGRITRVRPAAELAAADDDGAAGAVERLPGRALLPGFINAHSHAFQRLIRGRTQWRPAASPRADFWSWREAMYGAALALSPEDVFDASRFCFLEMLRAGITTVGEFHYLHRDPGGRAYADPNELAHRVAAAADAVGIRIALLNVCYATGAIGEPLRPEQRRFATPALDEYLADTQALLDAYAPRGGDAGAAGATGTEGAGGTGATGSATGASGSTAVARSRGAAGASGTAAARPAAGTPTAARDRRITVGIAPHSVRAVPRAWLRELHAWAAERDVAFHMHVSEQPAEIEACVDAYGARPVELLAAEDVFDERFTAVHATHLTPEEIALLGDSGATVCACPTTERDLGDGFLPGAELLDADTRIALGSDSHTVIDFFEEMRLVEYHERLRRLRRVVLAVPGAPERLECAPLLLELATEAGARSLRIDAGRIEAGALADFTAVDLGHTALAGWTAETLPAMLTLSAPPDVVSDVWVGGVRRLEGRRHALDGEAAEAFRRVAAAIG
ncbi:MAG TPA: amidohydrolase family protein [Longimicrobiales bacterium]